MRDSFGRAAKAPLRGLLVDLDGVVYVGDELVTGAAEALARLRTRRLALRFVTNTSTKPPGAVEEKLRRLGVAVEPGEVISAVRAACSTLRRLGCHAPYLVVDERIGGEFAGFVPVGAYPAAPSAAPDWVVIGDIGSNWDYHLMDRLFALISGGARLLTLHKGRSWQTGEGLKIDIGAFVAGLEYATGVTAIVTGKPSADFFRTALDEMAISAAEAAMVGDDIDNDIAGAQRAGIRGVLVRTGKYREAYAARSPVKPWRTLDSIAALEELVESTGEPESP